MAAPDPNRCRRRARRHAIGPVAHARHRPGHALPAGHALNRRRPGEDVAPLVEQRLRGSLVLVARATRAGLRLAIRPLEVLHCGVRCAIRRCRVVRDRGRRGRGRHRGAVGEMWARHLRRVDWVSSRGRELEEKLGVIVWPV